MEQKRLILVLLLSYIINCSNAQIPVPPAVKQFYSGMEQLATCNSASESGEIELKMAKCFFGDENSGMNLPNDFRYLEIDAGSISHNNDMLTSNNYINKLNEYVFRKKNLKPSVAISSFSRKTGILPTFDKKMSSEDAYVETIVKKKFSYLSSTGFIDKEFTDTVYTHVIQNKISVIVNGMGNSSNINPEILKIKAAQAYEEKRYIEAYDIFKKIIEHNRNDSESLYRLGLMTYYGKGCHVNKKKGISLMEESSYRGGYYSVKAQNVLRNWKYKNTL